MKALPKKPTCRGFTLIELLVVVTTVAILAAVLLPALAASKPRAQHMICMNNVKQMTLADIIYGEEYGQSIPGRNRAGSSGMWEQNLSPYLSKATNVFLCPVTTLPQIQKDSRWGNAAMPWCKQDNAGTGRLYFGSYGINGWLFNPDTGGYGDYGATDPMANLEAPDIIERQLQLNIRF